MRETRDGVLITVRVKTNSPCFALHEDGTLEVKSRPERGKANREIIMGLGKLFGCEAKIVLGLRSKSKMILLRGLNTERLNSARSVR